MDNHVIPKSLKGRFWCKGEKEINSKKSIQYAQRAYVESKIGVSRALYEKISEETQKKKKILKENAQEKKMEGMKEEVKPSFVLARQLQQRES
jgi:hypothetical protein